MPLRSAPKVAIAMASLWKERGWPPRDMEMMSTPSFTAASTAATMSAPEHPSASHALYMAILALGARPHAVPRENMWRPASGTFAPAAVEDTCVP